MFKKSSHSRTNPDGFHFWLRHHSLYGYFKYSLKRMQMWSCVVQRAASAAVKSKCTSCRKSTTSSCNWWRLRCTFKRTGNIFKITSPIIMLDHPPRFLWNRCYPPWNIRSPWKSMVGRLISFWDDLFSGAFAVSFRECNILVFGGVNVSPWSPSMVGS